MPDGRGHGVDVWSSAAWRELAVAWLDERLAAAGIERTGAVEQPRVRPWATVLKAPTTAGRVWLKAAGPGIAFEVPLYGLLQQAAPEHVLTPIAADVTRAWIVLPDGGASLGEHLGGTALVDALATALPQYAELQRALAPHTERLLALGVSDMRAAVMPARLDEALAVARDRLDRHGTASDRAAYARVEAMRETFAHWCERLAASPGAPSVDHNDLHPFNVLVPTAAAPAQVTFYDWGDSVVAHPFASMLVTLGFVQANVLAVGPNAPQVLRLRDAYLEAFSDLAPHAELVETLELACRVGKAARALTWHRALSTFASGDAPEHADAPLRCLRSLPDDSYLDGA